MTVRTWFLMGNWEQSQDGQRKYFYNTTTREASHHHPDTTVNTSEHLRAPQRRCQKGSKRVMGERVLAFLLRSCLDTVVDFKPWHLYHNFIHCFSVDFESWIIASQGKGVLEYFGLPWSHSWKLRKIVTSESEAMLNGPGYVEQIQQVRPVCSASPQAPFWWT